MKGERGDRVNARTRRASVSPCLARAIPANAREAAGPQSRLLLFSSWGTYQLRISRHQVCCNRSGQSGRFLWLEGSRRSWEIRELSLSTVSNSAASEIQRTVEWSQVELRRFIIYVNSCSS
ncbi:uncharacterized protein LOC114254404 isoform X1 [Monomorium pharaonis]|uniref:uncharacterized protein LOC114254404 isoform X1 n=1 Tax=Monomorium pharaonis TaxID=307658 RepID=UPI00102E1FF1|nr:uncharacterized protein LOC114254404 isoform X1 [Monomorium pharaonis]